MEFQTGCEGLTEVRAAQHRRPSFRPSSECGNSQAQPADSNTVPELYLHGLNTSYNLCDSNQFMPWTVRKSETTDFPAEMVGSTAARLMLIHKWPNGKGRHARLATDWRPRFFWGGGRDLETAVDARAEYMIALRRSRPAESMRRVRGVALFHGTNRTCLPVSRRSCPV
jgi:hypothetical protein